MAAEPTLARFGPTHRSNLGRIIKRDLTWQFMCLTRGVRLFALAFSPVLFTCHPRLVNAYCRASRPSASAIGSSPSSAAPAGCHKLFVGRCVTQDTFDTVLTPAR